MPSARIYWYNWLSFDFDESKRLHLVKYVFYRD